jgi:hypothetical protein
MLAAEIHHKIGVDRAPHQRLEDVLTSNVFSIFRYIDSLAPAASVLSCAVDAHGNKFDPPGPARRSGGSLLATVRPRRC